jgi:hypothetical protein
MIRLTTKAKTSKAHQVKKTDLWLMNCKPWTKARREAQNRKQT